MQHVFVVGGVSYNTMVYLDQFPEPRPNTVYSRGCHETIGSTGAGKALNLIRLGFTVSLQSLLGADEYGQKVNGILARTGIRYYPDIDPQGTERHVNLMDRDGKRISIYVAYCSQDPQIDTVRFEKVLLESDVVALNIQNYCRYLIPLIHRHGKKIWVDLHDYDGQDAYRQDFIDAADYILMSSEKMPDYRQVMESMIHAGKEIVVCTHGKEGSSALSQAGEWIELPILNTFERVDTNGAGDSFFAGFLYGMQQCASLLKCMQMATICSGMTITTRELYHADLSAEMMEYYYQKYY